MGRANKDKSGFSERHTDDSREAWRHWYVRAAERLARQLRQTGELSPLEAAATVAGVLPPELGRWLLRRLNALGWLVSSTQLPFDILDSAGCPPEFRGRRRELVRLAVFGLPGQGRPDYKHREASYQTICAQIVREANDLNQLSIVATRALSHSDVCRDPVLAALIRSFIAEREAVLHTQETEERQKPEDGTQLHKPFESAGILDAPTRQQLKRAFLRLRHEFEVHLAEYNEAAVRYVLEKMQVLSQRFPVHIKPAVVERHQKQFDDFLKRCTTFREQIEDVAKQASEAARAGNNKTAIWLIRRLRAIHALTPVLLSEERFEALRREIEQCGQRAEHREALRELIARERDVASTIKKAGAAVYRFQKVARSTTPETDEYKRAETAYRAAVKEIEDFDTDWLTSLLLELETYFEDLNDPTGVAQAQLDRFIGTVRNALMQLRREIRSIQEQRARGSQPNCSADAPPPAS